MIKSRFADGKRIPIPVRLSPSELKTLKILAVREGITCSEMLRMSLREAAKDRGIYAIGLISQGEQGLEIKQNG